LPQAYYNLGIALMESDLSAAAGAYRRAAALLPRYAEAWCNLAVALHRLGELDDSAAASRRAIHLQPQNAEAHWNLAVTCLLLGDFSTGLPEFEWRWKSRQFPSRPRNFSQPQWSGDDLAGRTILIHAEQGFGDTIQCVRYLPSIAARGGKVILESPPQLLRLFKNIPGVQRAISPPDPLPNFDVHCPVMSLPLAFKTTLETIPARAAYLTPDPELIEKWRSRIAPSTTGLRIGLNWSGDSTFRGDRTRSMTLSELAPLAAMKNATFFSLQKGPAAAQLENPPAGLEILPLGEDLHDFSDTAAAMSLLDLIITTDTSVPHLAGALGLPVWLMLQFVPDWRWLMDRPDSPWYPSMRLFRQPRPGDWHGVVNRVAEELAKFADSKV
jgi:hypothetical protein